MKLVCAGCCIAVAALAQETFSGSAALDAAVEESVRAGLIPGAVVVVGGTALGEEQAASARAAMRMAGGPARWIRCRRSRI